MVYWNIFQFVGLIIIVWCTIVLEFLVKELHFELDKRFLLTSLAKLAPQFIWSVFLVDK